MPANTTVIEFISVCRWTPIAIDTECIKSRSVAAIIVTSCQNKDLQVCTYSELATTNILAFLISNLSYAAKIVSPIRNFSARHIFRHHLLGLVVLDKPFFHVRWRRPHSFKHLLFTCWPIGALVFRNLPGLSSQFSSPWLNLTSCKGLAFTGSMVLFEGSRSRSANVNAVVQILIPSKFILTSCGPYAAVYLPSTLIEFPPTFISNALSALEEVCGPMVHK